ncbi:pilin isopeptide linkage protein [Alkalibaculum bacchi]|uniref:Pilin isopeptide linkage protein n=1 Tax=Alkalibaculum bacchi TaxID=645887 RepID=A0A366I8N4_9FIRM|nr:FctA domain-containing protein [Alkalibaculum bacchi]RBP64490.1 pilin isopeptide linkage protein [Alkalibaculum bacchi]
MKKFLVIFLALAMVFSMGGTAFATTPGYVDGSPVRIEKALTINNPGTVNPVETFKFTVDTGSGLRDGVAITAPEFSPASFTIDVAQGATTGFANIVLPTFTQVGVYTYPITEVIGNTAGMNYDGATYNLVVTVINNPNGAGFLRVLTLTDDKNVKRDAFKNDFDAGNLTIKKEVTGNYGDPNDQFTVTVTLTPIGDKVIKADPILASGGTKEVSGDGTVTITYTVKKGSEFTIQNIPYDVNYTVVEAANDKDYTVSYDANASGELDAAAITTTITNNRDTTVKTGISLDNLPYVILLVSALGGLVVFVMKKRLSHNS